MESVPRTGEEVSVVTSICIKLPTGAPVAEIKKVHQLYGLLCHGCSPVGGASTSWGSPRVFTRGRGLHQLGVPTGVHPWEGPPPVGGPHGCSPVGGASTSWGSPRVFTRRRGLHQLGVPTGVHPWEGPPPVGGPHGCSPVVSVSVDGKVLNDLILSALLKLVGRVILPKGIC